MRNRLLISELALKIGIATMIAGTYSLEES